MLHLRADSDASRNFSDYFHDWKDTWDTYGYPTGSEGFRASIQTLFDPVGGIRTGNLSFLYLPSGNSWVGKKIEKKREIT
jgi:hypothetical protein